MACTIEDVTDQLDASALDKALGDLLLHHEGDTKKFLVSTLDFLKRKTNFFKLADAKKRVLDAYREVSGEGDGFKAGFFGSKDSGSKPAVPKPAAPSAAAPQAPAEPSSAAIASAQPAAAAAAAAAAPEEAEEQAEQQPKGLKPNSGRGASYGHYSWTQTLPEVTVLVPVPPGTKARGLDVAIARDRLRVGLRGQPPILEGPLHEAVKPDDCLWNLADGAVEITLAKAEAMQWWRCVVRGDPEIDVQAVEPESSKLGDLDPETRATVEKMMFDQRQKAMGLPSSEEMQRQQMLQRFMAAHPEMDFSNAKVM